jgi:transcriptional regulator with XRE-family HTH domain
MKREEQCSNCGRMAHVRRSDYRFDEMGLPVVLQRIEVVTCQYCGNVDPIIPNINDLMHALALAVICDPCKLNGDEFRFLRKYVGKSGEEFGKLLHLGKTHVCKIETGATPIGDQTDKLVRFLVLHLSPELRAKADQFMKLLPDISDDCANLKQEVHIDPDTMQYCYA